jgi:murein DD-endopeptidase MepM/ murein hydrolase activator NlpD
VVSAGSLVIPVAGVPADRLRDSYDDPRSGGRVHHAIDIMAPHRTPVLAAADGTVLKLHNSGAGGTTLYLLDRDGVTRYYYAHLDGYVAGIREGQEVFRGQVVAFVGDTGNAGRGNYHLHFSVAILGDPKRWWEGENVNPYLLLTSSGARLTRAYSGEREGALTLP